MRFALDDGREREHEHEPEMRTKRELFDEFHDLK